MLMVEQGLNTQVLLINWLIKILGIVASGMYWQNVMNKFQH